MLALSKASHPAGEGVSLDNFSREFSIRSKVSELSILPLELSIFLSVL